MSLIQCDELCRFQKEGYCRLETPSTVNTENKACPYFKKNLFDDCNGFLKTSDTYKL